MKLFFGVILMLLLSADLARGDTLWSRTTTNFMYTRQNPAAAVIGDKAFFLGGTHDPVGQQVVEIYDAATGQWSISQLPGVASGLCVGGAIGSVAAFASYNGTTFVYDDSDGSWTMGTISPRRSRIGSAASTDRIFFAGGFGNGGDYDTINVYEPETGLWSVEHLSVSRWGVAGASTGDTVVFAGGDEWNGPWQDRVDILDETTGIWSTSTLSGRASVPAATSVGDKILVGGGYGDGGFRTEVDILDTDSGEWETTHLSQGRDLFSATSIGPYALFGSGWYRVIDDEYAVSDVVDIYNVSTQQWHTEQLSVGRYDATAVTVGNKVLFAGGINVERERLDVVDIFTIPEPSSIGLCFLAVIISVTVRLQSVDWA